MINHTFSAENVGAWLSNFQFCYGFCLQFSTQFFFAVLPEALEPHVLFNLFTSNNFMWIVHPVIEFVLPSTVIKLLKKKHSIF